jgi:D-3-phosphoglycerate dehydrogenase / 2-oxoglutarate reductase
MPKVLANDGIDAAGKQLLEQAGFTVDTANIPQEGLLQKLNNYDCLTVRGATKVRQPLIDTAPNIKLIVRGGVGLDNIDVSHAEGKGIVVRNTPLSSTLSVAELVFAHLFSLVRFLYDSNRKMPVEGLSQFKELKEKYSKGTELRGKTLGILGFGNIGQETARIGLGLGMNIIVYDVIKKSVDITLKFPGNQTVKIPVATVSKEEVIKQSDFITIHAAGNTPVLFHEDFEAMKTGVGIINIARGGVIKEKELLEFLNNGKVAYAGIDVFEEEPTKNTELLQHPKVSLSPHIGASTIEGQKRVGTEVANIIIDFFKTHKS